MTASTKRLLASAGEHLAESIGARDGSVATRLAPETQAIDLGRRPGTPTGQIEVDRIAPDPNQPRLAFSEESIRRLADSLCRSGQIAPIRVRWSAEDNKWLIVAGERRWRAAQLAGLTTIECCFDERPLDQGDLLRLQLVENLLRENLKPIEEAKAFRRLMDEGGHTGKQVAAELSVPESKVSRSLALLRLPEAVQADVEAGRIPPRVACEIARVPTPAEQHRLAALAAEGQVGVKEISKAVRTKKRARNRRPAGVKLTFPLEDGWNISVACRRKANYHEVERALQQALEDVQLRIRSGVQLL